MTRLFSSAAILPLIIATPALADVTADDLWSYYQDSYAQFGVNLTVNQARDGNVVTWSDISAEIVLPMDFGEITLRTGPFTLTENSDGSLNIDVPGAGAINFFGIFGPDDDVTVTGQILTTSSGLVTVVTGAPDDMTLTSTYDEITFEIADLDLTSDVEDLPFVFELSGNQRNGNSVTRIVNADLTNIEMTYKLEEMNYTFHMSGPDGLDQTQTGQTRDTQSRSLISIPDMPLDYMNIASAIRAGLAIQMDATSASSTTLVSGRDVSGMVMNQDQRMGATQQSLSFGADGLSFDGAFADITAKIGMPEFMPMDIDLAIPQGSYAFDIPIQADIAAQDFRYMVSITDITVNEDIWRLVDPSELIARDPIDFTIDLGADVILKQDLLDFNGVMALANQADDPLAFFDIETVKLDALNLSAAGAALVANGAFTLDMTDMVTMGGFPRPEGRAEAEITGYNQLVDTLIEMGVLAAEDAMAARMGLAMFTQATGDDAVATELEVNAEGHVIVNGQRIR
ncbi:hypothetical protein [Aestuariibius sp. HNIBRBA575]|uniref:hypothetical protein n=1 Tax=Aestuariibius sp. HNIBRBA575 TaxID=3233343 RepID=UPI0034A447FA